jgi:hypothetical protein
VSDVIYQGDQGTVLNLTIRDSNQVVDLTDATVQVLIRLKDMGILKAATIIDSQSGKCQITLNSQDIQYEGVYQLQATVTFLNGTKFSSSIQRFIVNKKMGYIPSVGGGNGGSTEVIGGNNGHILVNGLDIKVYDDATLKQDISTLKNSDLATSNSINNINISLSGISTDLTDLNNKKHTHTNLSTLNQLSTDGTNLLFNGASLTFANAEILKRLGISANGILTIDGVEITLPPAPTTNIDGGTFTTATFNSTIDGGSFTSVPTDNPIDGGTF